jgi:hypothetical protein
MTIKVRVVDTSVRCSEVAATKPLKYQQAEEIFTVLMICLDALLCARETLHRCRQLVAVEKSSKHVALCRCRESNRKCKLSRAIQGLQTNAW